MATPPSPTWSPASPRPNSGQVADTDGSGEIDPALVDRALVDADAEIDAALVGRYALPMDPIPDLLVRVASDLARESLYTDAPPDVVSGRAKRARELLAQIAAGQDAPRCHAGPRRKRARPGWSRSSPGGAPRRSPDREMKQPPRSPRSLPPEGAQLGRHALKWPSSTPKSLLVERLKAARRLRQRLRRRRPGRRSRKRRPGDAGAARGAALVPPLSDDDTGGGTRWRETWLVVAVVKNVRQNVGAAVRNDARGLLAETMAALDGWRCPAPSAWCAPSPAATAGHRRLRLFPAGLRRAPW
jgi:hypothetical protein